MAYEVDFLQVGNGETSGDCIALRVGELDSGDYMKQYVVVIDGGFQESGEKMVEHINKYYGTNYADVVVSTHLDRDHIGGLIPIVEKMGVGKLIMHQPWNHAVRGDGDRDKEAAAARRAYEKAALLEELALAKTPYPVQLMEPLAGTQIPLGEGAYMWILGPDLSYYEELLKDFDHNESALAKLAKEVKLPVKSAVEILRKVQETLDPSTSTLDHVHKDTTPENNSSAIIYFNLNGHELLFTGDAGVDALHKAANHADTNGISLINLNLFDVPHHGSKHNLDTAFLNRISAKTAFISATKDSKKHPSPRVRNELVRRGYSLATTEDCNIHHHRGAPDRPDYSPLTPLGLVEEFDEDE